MVSAQLPSVAQPEPALAAAPSPIAGNQGTLCRAGQREEYSGSSPVTRSFTSPRGGNCSGRTPSTLINSLSHWRVRITSMPDPEAIEKLQTESPKKCLCRYSPKENH